MPPRRAVVRANAMRRATGEPPDRRRVDAVVQDLSVSYLDSDGSRHLFRVWEAVIPRIKQADAIVVLHT